MALIIGIIISSVVACFMFKASPKRAVKDAAHTMDHISWVALLNLDDKNGAIKAQFMSGLVLLVANIFLMYFLAFRF